MNEGDHRPFSAHACGHQQPALHGEPVALPLQAPDTALKSHAGIESREIFPPARDTRLDLGPGVNDSWEVAMTPEGQARETPCPWPSRARISSPFHSTWTGDT